MNGGHLYVTRVKYKHVSNYFPEFCIAQFCCFRTEFHGVLRFLEYVEQQQRARKVSNAQSIIIPTMFSKYLAPYYHLYI